MKRMIQFLVLGLGLPICLAAVAQGLARTGTEPSRAGNIHKAEQSMVLILVGDGGGRVRSASTGVVVRSDGIVLTSYHLLKNAQEVQVRLRDGEIYDQVDLIGFDERRDVAALHFSASGLASLTCASLDEAATGEKIYVLDANAALTWSSSDGILGPVRLADDVMGAGHGYRVIQFMAPLPHGTLGGALVNSRGQLLGMITASPNPAGLQFAVPAESIAGLPAQGLRTVLGTGKSLEPPPLIPNAGPAREEPISPVTALATARTLRVTSKTTFFSGFMLEKELVNNTEFRDLGLNVVNGHSGEDLLVNVDRPLFTYDFTYVVSDSHTGTVLATGKVTAIDGPHAAQGIASQLVRTLDKAQALQPATANGQQALSVQ